MSFLKKNTLDSEEYLIRLDALQVALDFTAAARSQGRAYGDREFLLVTDHVADYLRAGKVPEILGKATKAVIKG